MTEADRRTRYTLLERLKDPRDAAAWEQFYLFYWELITGWAIRFGCSPTRAEDVFQETMICLLRKLQDFEYDPAKGSFRGLLKTITRSRVLDMFRREGRYKVIEDVTLDPEVEHDLVGQDESADDLVWMQTVLQQALRRAYDKIDQATYKSFCLYVLEGVTVHEVCRRLGITRPGTVYQQKSRFLKLLEKEFFELLDDFDEVCGEAVSTRRSQMVKALEEMIRNKPDYRETIVQPQQPRNLDRLAGVVDIMRRNGFSGAVWPESLLLLRDGKVFAHELSGRLRIGKKSECDIVIDAIGISGVHAEVGIDADNCYVADLNSANGIYLNGRRIEKEAVSSGDIIRLNDHICLIYLKK